MEYPFEKILITEKEIKDKIKKLANQINKDYKGKNLIMICILRGAFVFFADLIREIKIPVELDFMAVSSYDSQTQSTGNVKIVKDIQDTVDDKHVLVIEDIIDSGYTMLNLRNIFKVKNAKSFKSCVLLDKVDRRVVDIQADYVGFKIPDEFVVGYGLDCAERFRNLKDIRVLQRSYYTK